MTATATRLAVAFSFQIETSEFSPGVTVVEGKPLDFGDAPSDAEDGVPDYQTLLADDGAFHLIAAELHLGSAIDPEADGRPHGDANGDDQDGSDDEDGVTLPARIARWTTFDVPVDVTGSGRLDAWIDFNQDGTWDDSPGSPERIYSGAVDTGTTVITATAPGSTVLGHTYARFRLSRGEVPLPPTGPAGDGEVEDYRLLLASWQNPNIAEDVNDDGNIVPLDALIIINELNEPMHSDPSTGRLEPMDETSTLPFLDVNNDGYLVPIDALIIINMLNGQSGRVEAEYPPLVGPRSQPSGSMVDHVVHSLVARTEQSVFDGWRRGGPRQLAQNSSTQTWQATHHLPRAATNPSAGTLRREISDRLAVKPLNQLEVDLFFEDFGHWYDSTNFSLQSRAG